MSFGEHRWEDGRPVANNDEQARTLAGVRPRGRGSPGEPRRIRSSPWAWIVGFLLVLVLFNYLAAPRPNTIDYSNFLARVQDGQIVGTLEISQTSVSGRYEDSTGQVDFTTTIPPILQGTSTLTDQLDAAGISYTGVTPNGLQSFLIGWVVPLLLFGFLWFFLIRRMSGAQAGAALNLGRNKVKIYDRKEMKTTFADVAGVDEAKEELREIVDFLQQPEEVPTPRRPDPQGRAAAGSARVRQDAARARGRRRGQRAVLLHVRLGVRRDVRRPRRRARPRAVPAGEGEGARARLPRRDRHDRQGPRRRDGRRLRRARRARADAEPAPGRDGRVRLPARASSSWPPRTAPTCSTPRSSDRAGSTARSSSIARPEGPRGDPEGARPRRRARPERRSARARGPDAGVHRGRPRERRERGRAARRSQGEGLRSR